MMTIYTVTWDGDAGTWTHVFLSEKARDNHIRKELQEGFADLFEGDMPDDPWEAYEALQAQPCTHWWLSTDTHTIPAIPVHFSPLGGMVAA